MLGSGLWLRANRKGAALRSARNTYRSVRGKSTLSADTWTGLYKVCANRKDNLDFPARGVTCLQIRVYRFRVVRGFGFIFGRGFSGSIFLISSFAMKLSNVIMTSSVFVLVCNTTWGQSRSVQWTVASGVGIIIGTWGLCSL
jgi:hypothetical protein